MELNKQIEQKVSELVELLKTLPIIEQSDKTCKVMVTLNDECNGTYYWKPISFSHFLSQCKSHKQEVTVEITEELWDKIRSNVYYGSTYDLMGDLVEHNLDFNDDLINILTGED
jgi:hypothetical protein